MDYPTLKPGSFGSNVVTAKKGVYKALKIPLPYVITPLYGPFFIPQVKQFQKMKGIDETGWIGPATWKALAPYIKPPSPKLVYPHPESVSTSRPSFIHETGGISGNWALDFMAPGGTTVLAPEEGTVTRLSGHDPSTGVHNGDIFGRSVYIRTASGFYYGTHFGSLSVTVGATVKAGQRIGSVGHWPNDPGRSHTHLGFTSGTGSSAVSVSHIKAVSAAPKVDPLPYV